ncbi:unnamed protein product [Callosobruchus maculatus]|uniref:C2H2-type domain-containing protein n=1 Tax=Callosobruchus maculatus TaxID=64391 RepID=A0A653DM60_CALMS|nr:unnamed protein product [Callosobruchus maculatus]
MYVRKITDSEVHCSGTKSTNVSRSLNSSVPIVPIELSIRSIYRAIWVPSMVTSSECLQITRIDFNNPECTRCGKRYKYESSLKFHLRYQCQKEPQFVCTLCPYKTCVVGNLRRHSKLKHQEVLYTK